MLVNSNTNEFELHAAVNPVDQDNIVIGCIKLDPTSLVEPISIGMYSTNDGADTWVRSNFTGLLEPGSTALGGGDPIVVFDNDGIAPFVMVGNYFTTNKFLLGYLLCYI